MSHAALSRLLGLSEQETSNAVEILVASGVADRDQNGAIINRRMVREEELRQKRKEIGSKGGSKTAASREQTPDNDNDNGLERVREFAKGEGIRETDADWFYWKGRGNGWTNGGKPMKDWKSTLRSWNKAGYLPSQKQSNNGQRPFQSRPKEPAPIYPKMSEKREPTDEEFQTARRRAAEHVEKLKNQFKMP